MPLRRLVTTLAAATVLAATAACSKQAADGRQGVGAKIDHAVDAAHEKLEKAGEWAKEEIGEAAQKTQEALSKAGEKISVTASPPYSPRQPVNDTPAAAATVPGGAAGAAPSAASASPHAAAAPAATAPAPPAPQGTNASTTSTTSAGPTPNVKRLGLSEEARSRLGDAAIIASIKAGLLADGGLGVLKIDVDANDGVVTLNGLADDEAAKQRAERSAGSVQGVREVRNYLSIERM